MMMNGRMDRKQGFTLLELLVVIAVIGILMGLLSTALFKSKAHAKRTQAKTEIKALASGLRSYRLEYGRWPLNPSLVSGSHVFVNNNHEIVKYMRDDSDPTKNPRNIQFVNWNDFYTLNDEDERVPLGDYQAAHPDSPIVDPYGKPLEITIDLDRDLGRVKSPSLDNYQQDA